MATRKKTKTQSKPVARKAKQKVLVRIGVVPPELVPGSKAFALDQRMRRPQTHPSATELAKVPWLSQEKAFQAGYHLLTEGLRAHADHPELEMCNVPGAFVPEALHLLETISGYVLEGTRLDPGEEMLLSERPLAMLAFLKVEPGKRGTEHEQDVLRVVFLS